MRLLRAIRANPRSYEIDIFHDESLRKYNLGDFHILQAKGPVALDAIEMHVLVIIVGMPFVAVAEFVLGFFSRKDLMDEMMRSECG